MANKMKRSIAMLLVLNMLTGMLPVQALADEGNAEAPEIVVTVTPSESSSSSEKSESSSEKSESSSSEKSESSSEKSESSSEKSESSSEKSESSSSEKSESSSEKSESSSEKSESSSEKSESSSEKSESSSTEKTEFAPTEEKTESAPAEEKTESVPAEEKTESAPTEETEPAPVEETVVETAVEETASYNDETATTSESESEMTEFDGKEPELDHDSKLNFGKEIDGTVIETTETTTDDAGNTTVTETTTVTTKGETEDGGEIEGEETYVESETKNADGEVIGTDWELDGSETTKWDIEDDGSEAGQPDVTVDLIPGKETDASATTTTVTGDKPKGENDANYNYTVTTETDRIVTAETSTTGVTVNDTDSGLVADQDVKVNGVLPVYDENDNLHINPENGQPLDKVNGEYVGKEDVFDRNYMSIDSVYKNPSSWEVPAGGDFRHVGTGEHSKHWNARVKVIYQKDEAGNTIFDENGVPLVEAITKKDGTIVTVNGIPATELPNDVTLKPIFDDYNGGRPTTFLLMDETGNQVTTYCCDMDTSAKKGSWYSISNLEDSGYYATEESEEHIRSIVMNGYWGTSDIPKEDGSYEMGSLEKIKQDLMAAIENGEMEDTVEIPMVDADGNPVVDENGNPKMEICSMTELLNDLSAGEALLATQSAIWSYSNGHYNTMNGKDGTVVIDPDGYQWTHDPGENENEPMDDYGSARVDFLYKWLIGLETEEESTIVINEKNFVKDMSITVHDKVDERETVNDKGETEIKGVYDTDLNFKLAFIPGEKDDLLVQISYTDLDGNPVNVVKRLAGENADGQTYEDIKPEDDGSYVLKGLKLSENEDFAFDLRLEGTQYLENGVYFYAPVNGRNSAQSMVGIAEGEKNVDVSIGVTIRFDVDENNHVVAERRWHSEKDPQREERDTPPPPAEYRMARGVGQLEIIDEEVPLAAPPQTGDMSILWFAMIALSGCGLCILNLLEKRKCRA